MPAAEHTAPVGEPPTSLTDRADPVSEAAHRIAAAARRLDVALDAHRPLLGAEWADHLRADLGWLATTLSYEYVLGARLDRLLAALHRLTDGEPRARGAGALAAGAARAGALLERRLTLARTKAHSTALRAAGSARFHAVADAVAVLASEPPPDSAPGAHLPASALSTSPAVEDVRRRLCVSLASLAFPEAGAQRSSAGSLVGGAEQDAAWERARLLLRAHRYAREVLAEPARAGAAREAPPTGPGDDLLRDASRVLDRHHEASEAAACAAEAAETPRIAPATAYALGVLHADQRHEATAARRAFARLCAAPGGLTGASQGASGASGDHTWDEDDGCV
ncbi:CHAD domain-containing protein [Streptomyces sulphureus]|uniref:CHAD domain-containing protein n=1 Tax=Streptomyces sulphureus TaxID=47758 RepID=UPI00037AC68A|nr:CHAD domain-containing protein [Streptomyces sulphureus]